MRGEGWGVGWGVIYIQVDGVARGSLSSLALANIFATKLKIEIMTSLRNYLQNWKQFLDDIFAFVLTNKIVYIVNQVKSFDENIQFLF